MNDRKNYLKTLKAQKQEELEVVQTQLSQTLSKQYELRLNRSAEDLLKEIEELEKKIQEIDKQETSIDHIQYIELTGKQREKLQENLIYAYSDMASLEWMSAFKELSKTEDVEDVNTIPFTIVIREPSILIGYTIEHYVLQTFVSAGGSGLVYRAWNTKLGQEVCIKIFYPLESNLTSILEIISRGLRGIARLNHYNIVKIFDFSPFEIGGENSFYIVMEWVEGKSLDDWSNELIDNDQSIAHRLKMAFKIATALKDAHSCKYIDELGFEQTGVLHGDIKPGNIIVRPDNSPVIIDFMMIDIQRLLDPKVVPSYLLNKSVTRKLCTMACGTPGFMAPEQENKGIVTQKTDIYSFGITLCYMFSLENLRFELLVNERNDRLYQLKNLLRKMTDPNPENRPQNMKVVVKRIKDIATEMKLNLSISTLTLSECKNRGEISSRTEIYGSNRSEEDENLLKSLKSLLGKLFRKIDI